MSHVYALFSPAYEETEGLVLRSGLGSRPSIVALSDNTGLGHMNGWGQVSAAALNKVGYRFAVARC